MHACILTSLMALAWLSRLIWSGSAVLLLRQPALLRPIAFCASCLAPMALLMLKGPQWYKK